MREVTQAIAAFERTRLAGNSPFDRFYFGGERDALTAEQQRGFGLFVNQGRCVSCHTIEQDHALFSDSRFHNVGVGNNRIQPEVPALAGEFLKAEATASQVDLKVLTDKRTSELGRFAVSRGFEISAPSRRPPCATSTSPPPTCTTGVWPHCVR